MAPKIYKTPTESLHATDEFYRNEQGFGYTEKYVTDWVRKHLKLPKRGRALDLCCGNGIWSRGIKNVRPKLEIFGIDVSEGGIEKAKQLLKTDDTHFVIGDAESDLPFPQGFFDVIFARGPGLYNQHDMDRPTTIRIIEMWHTRLTESGVFYSVFASAPDRMGGYTPMDQVVLPYNRCPRQTEAVQFEGGKYHHTIGSFLAPFWKAANVQIQDYAFFNNLHFLVTRLEGGHAPAPPS